VLVDMVCSSVLRHEIKKLKNLVIPCLLLLNSKAEMYLKEITSCVEMENHLLSTCINRDLVLLTQLLKKMHLFGLHVYNCHHSVADFLGYLIMLWRTPRR